MNQVDKAMSAEREAYPPTARALVTLGLLTMAYVISLIDRQVLALMVNPIKADLGISDFQMSLLQGFAFALFFCILGIPSGRLADRYSRKTIIIGGILLWSLMTISCGFAGNYAMLFVARMGVGVGEAALAPAGYSLIADSFRKDRLVWATSAFTLGGMFGCALALLLGGLVIDYVSHQAAAPFGLDGLKPWQVTFILVGLPGFVAAGLLMLMKEPSRKGGHEPAPPFGAAFMKLWSRRRDYTDLYLVGALMSVAYYGGLTWLPTHLIRTFGLSPGETGLLLGVIYLVAPILGVTVGSQMNAVFTARGHTDAALRTVMIVAIGAAATYFAPLLPTLESVAVLWFISLVFQSSYYGNVMTALQILTPNRLRATNVAILTIVINMAGAGLGTAIIAALADRVFPGDPRGIGQALTIVGILSGLAAALVAAGGLKRLREAMAQHAQA